MKKLISFLLDKKNVIKKFFFTLLIVFIYVIGTQIYIPFLSKETYQLLYQTENHLRDSSSSIFKINSLTLFSLSIFPYITASIIVQFLQKVVPLLKEWSEQGEKGKYKINLLTRSLTVLCALVQGWATIRSVESKLYLFRMFRGVSEFSKIETFSCLCFLVVGVFICTWLSDLITSKGIGNGVSILIVIGITDQLFNIFKYLFNFKDRDLIITKILVLFLFLILLVCAIVLSLGYLKISINYALDKINNKIDKYIPIKVNISGVLPIILADTFLNINQYIQIFFPDNISVNYYINIFSNSRSDLGIAFFVYLLLIMFFAFFSSFMTINPNDISEHLSKQNAYLKDTKPGKSTVKKITQKMFTTILVGTVFLTLLAAAPDIINFVLKCVGKEQVSQNIKFGGTSFLIIVGTAIEVIQNIKEQKNVKKYYNKFF